MRDIKQGLQSSEAFLHQLLEIDRISVLGEMAGGVAHELNQPLAAIAIFSQAGARMLDRPDPLVDRALDVFRQISQEALHAGERLQSIRRLFERERPERCGCGMLDVLAQVQPTLKSLAQSINAELRVDAPEVSPEVRVDRLRIQHVLLELVKNAVDASVHSPGERIIRIDVSTERYTVETGITDFGTGVPAEVEDHLFRPFFTTKPLGNGLGLASSRAIVESHDGTIGFRNLPTGGVRFWFKLPLASD